VCRSVQFTRALTRDDYNRAGYPRHSRDAFFWHTFRVKYVIDNDEGEKRERDTHASSIVTTSAVAIDETITLIALSLTNVNESRIDNLCFTRRTCPMCIIGATGVARVHPSRRNNNAISRRNCRNQYQASDYHLAGHPREARGAKRIQRAHESSWCLVRMSRPKPARLSVCRNAINTVAIYYGAV